MIVDALNLGFRWKALGASDFLEDYMRTVESLKKSYKCQKLIIAGDWGSSSYRKALYPEYKGNRTKKYAEQTEEEAEDFERFIEEMNRIYAKYSEDDKYPVLRFKNVEADDIAAYVCSKKKTFGVPMIWLISSDRDWSTLIDEGINQFSYVTRKETTLDNWEERFDCTTEELISIKVLMGDAGDNVPGVPGIGPKRALELVKEYGSAYEIAANLPISSKYKYISNLNNFGADNLILNYRLMDLITHCEEALGEENCKAIDQTLLKYYG